MVALLVDFANLLLAALLVGAMCGVWFLFKPANLPAGSYVALHQHSVRALNTPLPAIGAATALVTLVSAALGRADHARGALLLGSALCFAAGGAVTRFLNQPINAVVMTWAPDAPPANWQEFRDAWWRWHVLRFGAGLAGLCLLVVATLRRT